MNEERAAPIPPSPGDEKVQRTVVRN